MKIGLIALSTDLKNKKDFHSYCKHEVYTTRIIFENPITPKSLKKLQQQIVEAKLRFPFIMDRYIFGCTSGTAYIGQSNIDQCINPLSSCADFLTYNSIKSLSLLTPYTEIVHNKVRDWFIEQGFSIENEKYLNYESDLDIAVISENELLKQISSMGTGVVFASCTSLPMMQLLERTKNTKWLSSNQSMIWKLNNESS